MKIGYFINHFPFRSSPVHTDICLRYHCGGAEYAAYFLALEMVQGGHDVTVYTTSANSDFYLEEYDNLKIYRYGTNLKIGTSNVSFGQFNVPIDQGFDIIHTHFDLAPGPLAGVRYAKKAHIPLVITYHGDWVDTYGGIIRRIGVALNNLYCVDKILNAADRIISPSTTYIERSRFLKQYKDKTVIIPNGINVKDFEISYSKEACRMILGLPVEGKIILFFGYLSPYKGPDVLLKALSTILTAVPDVTLVFAGAGVMRDDLESLSRQLGIAKNVRFVGSVEEGMKPLYYKAADIFCLPSVGATESFGIVNLEAMALGTPIVASDIGGIPDVVKDGENGVLVQPGNAEELAHAIIRLLNKEDLRRRMGRCGHERVKLYSWEVIARDTLSLYDQIVADSVPRS